MKSYCFAFLLCLLSVIVKAQQQTVSIGTNDTKHHAVLYLHSPSGNQGLIIPIVTNRNSMLAGAATQAGMIQPIRSELLEWDQFSQAFLPQMQLE